MRSRFRWAAAALAGALLAPMLASAASAAEAPADEAVPIEETFTVAEGDGVTTGNGYPHISSDPVTGRSLIIFNHAIDGDTFEDEVHGRVIDNMGVIGEEFRIDTTLPSAGFDGDEPPFASWNSTNSEWLASWTDDAIVYGQRVDADGTLIGDNFVIAANKSGITPDVGNDFSGVEHVRAEWSPADEAYLVSWKAAGNDAGVSFTQTILATVIDLEGNWVLDGDAVDVSEEEANDGVAVAYSATSNVWLVAWERQSGGELPGARVLSVDPDGALFDIIFDSAALAVSTGGVGIGGTPELAWDSTRDRFIILWRADQGEGDQNFFNFVGPDGAFDEGDEQQLGDVIDTPMRARVAYSPVDDEYAVVSHVAPSAEEAGEVFTWTVSGDGATLSDTTVIATTDDPRAHPSVSYGGGCFRYTWWGPGEFWGGGDLPDSVFAYVQCEGCLDFGLGSDAFTDVVAGRFYDVPIGWLDYLELTTGTAPGVFSPDDGITRGQHATFLWRDAGEPTAPLGSATFTDVEAGKFYDAAVGWMFEEEITTGTSATTFHPERTLTRGEMATFMWRGAGEPAGSLGSAKFSDVSAGRFYDSAIGWLVDEELTTGTTPTTFEPDRELTRGELATFLFRFSGDLRCADL